MERVTRSTNTDTKPAVPVGEGIGGYFTPGNPATGTPATVPGYEWFNRVQEEIVTAIEAAGLVLDPADDTQLTQAILALIAANAVGGPGEAFTDTTGVAIVLDGNGDAVLQNTATGTVAFTAPNLAAGNEYNFTVIHKQDAVGGHAIALPAGTTWPYGAPPIWPSLPNAWCKFVLTTRDLGATWEASWIGADYA